VYPAYAALTGFQQSHGRELEVYRNLRSDLQPDVFGVYADESTETYLILMEYLEDVTLLNSVMSPESWTDTHIRQALDQLAGWHAQHLDRQLPLNPVYWTDAPSKAYMLKLTPLWTALLQQAARAFPDLYTAERTVTLQEIIGAIGSYWQELEQLPKTLVHNDLNPRNACFKQKEGPQLCVYDWELATYHVPQYDVVELLCFVLDADRYPLRLTYMAHYQTALHELTGRYADQRAFQRGFELAAFDFGIHRLGLYMMAHTISPYPFLPRVVNSYFDTLAQLRHSNF
jgi:aminoglycoside/choline kinase family phosphotransferase